jgi:hypothetical protein
MKNSSSRVCGAAVLLGGLMTSWALSSSQVGVPISRAEAATIAGGACGADVKQCQAKGSCPSNAVFLAGTQLQGFKPYINGTQVLCGTFTANTCGAYPNEAISCGS